MTHLIKIVAPAMAALALSACATNEKMSRSEPPASRQATGAAESACMEAVNRNCGGPRRGPLVSETRAIAPLAFMGS